MVGFDERDTLTHGPVGALGAPNTSAGLDGSATDMVV